MHLLFHHVDISLNLTLDLLEHPTSSTVVRNLHFSTMQIDNLLIARDPGYLTILPFSHFCGVPVRQ